MDEPEGYPGVVRVVVPADNSCLFAAVSLLLPPPRKSAATLRAECAAFIGAHPAFFSDAVLGQSPASYVAWISDPSRWGGALELTALANMLGCGIAAVDIKTLRVDRYTPLPELQGGTVPGEYMWMVVVYDGIHYDPLTLRLAPGGGAAREFDVGMHGADSIDTVVAGAVELARAARARSQFTDTAGFQLKCLVCGAGLVGEKAAMEHAAATGHTNFSQ